GGRTGSNSAEGQDDHVTAVPNDAIQASRSEYRFEVLPDWTAERAAEAVAAAREAAGPGVPVYALAQLGNFASEASFASTLRAVKRLGIDHFRIYEYGLLSERHLTWLENAKDVWTRAEHGTSDVRGRDVG